MKFSVAGIIECCPIELTQQKLTIVCVYNVAPNNNSCLDNFAHNFRQKCQYEVKDYGLSDHTAQIIHLKINKTSLIKSWYTLQRDISKTTLDKFKNHLKSLSFSDVYSTQDPDQAYNNFLEIFQLLYNLRFPLIK